MALLYLLPTKGENFTDLADQAPELTQAYRLKCFYNTGTSTTVLW